ncbi:hypothetical protein WDW37_06610 [Bdellovibrionota bacterium FG-1]
MKHLYLIQQSRLKVKWANLVSPELRLVLITNPLTRNKLPDTDANRIDRLVVTEDFRFENLLAIIESDPKCLEDSIVFVTTDEFLVATVAQLNEHFGLPGVQPEQALRYLNKEKMKQALVDSGIRYPRFVRFEPQTFELEGQKYLKRILRYTGLPCFIKPLTAAGALGTEKIENPEQLLRWANGHLGDYEYEIDEFITGELFHLDSIILKWENQPHVKWTVFFSAGCFF